ncbi:hypothetical protein L195_g060831, partial [Trifolium pratense]
MSGEESTPRSGASGAGEGSGGSGGKAAFGHDYLNNESYEHSGNRKAPVFN